MAPSPPICEAVAVCCGLTSVAIQWQPMPASARLPSGTGVERLCGHPAQKPGLRMGAGRLLSVAPGASGALKRAVRIVARNRLDQNSGDEFGRDLAEIGNSGRAWRSVEREPVEIFADDARRPRIAIEYGANLILEQRAFLLDHNDEIEAAGEIAHDHRIKRPHHADFEQTQAKRGAVVVEAEIAERLQQVLPGLAGGDHADPCALAVANDAVEAVGARVGERSGKLVLVEPLFLRDRRIKGARPKATGRSARPLRENDLQAGRARHKPCRRLRRRR